MRAAENIAHQLHSQCVAIWSHTRDSDILERFWFCRRNYCVVGTHLLVTVPSAIGTMYTSATLLLRNSDSKTDLAYGSNGFRILPKITTWCRQAKLLVIGDGERNHLCQSVLAPFLSVPQAKSPLLLVWMRPCSDWSDTAIAQRYRREQLQGML